MISVLYKPDARAIFSKLRPLLLSKYSKEFSFSTNPNQLRNDRNKHILIIRYFKGRYHFENENISLLKYLNSKYTTVSYFDDGDGADSVHGELLPFLDHYFKSQIYQDKSVYLNPAYGRQQFSEYYHKNYDVVDEKPDIRKAIDSNDLYKIKLLWGLGVSRFPIENKKINVLSKLFNFIPFTSTVLYSESNWKTENLPLKNRIKKIQARFSYGNIYANSIGYQRKLILDIASSFPEKFLTGRVTSGMYNKEIKNVFGVISPFGWGEVCFRDYETVMNNTLLLKPNMQGILSYPNIYIENQTYIPISWDMSDLSCKVDSVVNDLSSSQRIVENAKLSYYNQIANLDTKIEYLINTLTENHE